MKCYDHTPLPRRLRAITLSPAVVHLMHIPADVDEMSKISDIDVCRTGLEHLPIPLVNLSDWIACFQAAPHRDPDWKDCVFVTMAISAEHTFETMVAPGKVVALPIVPGTLFVFDPLLLHWLKPKNPDQETGFAAIQWSVNRSEFTGHYRSIRKGLSALGNVHSRLVDLKDEGWRVSFPTEALKP